MRHTFVLERIEGRWAVLETDSGKTFEFPLVFLPEGIHEGAYLTFDIGIDAEAEKKALEEMKKLRDSLKQS